MTYEGTVKNGVVVFKAEPPPDGTDVSVTPVQEPIASPPDEAEETIWQKMEKFAGVAPS